MSEDPSPETIQKMHRWFAVECNNGAWNLSSKPERTQVEDREMLYMAYSAAYHWSKMGLPLNDARADMTLAHVHAVLGHGALALSCAQRCLDYFETYGGEDWDLAFANLEMAFAGAASGDQAIHARYYAQAKSLGEAIRDDQDRQIFFEELARIPGPIKG